MACLVVMQMSCFCCKFHLVFVSVTVTLAKLYCCSPVACSQQHYGLVHSLRWGFVFGWLWRTGRPRSSNHRYHLITVLSKRFFLSILSSSICFYSNLRAHFSLGHVLFVQYFILSQESNSRLHPLQRTAEFTHGPFFAPPLFRALYCTLPSLIPVTHQLDAR